MNARCPDLADRAALVTGAAKGTGRRIASRRAREGVEVGAIDVGEAGSATRHRARGTAEDRWW